MINPFSRRPEARLTRRLGTRLLSAAVLTTLCTTALSAQTTVAPAPLLLPLPDAVDPMLGVSTKIARSQPVMVDFALLREARVGDVLRFPTFDGEQLHVRLNEREPIPALPGAFHWHGEFRGDAHSHITMTVVGDRLSAWTHRTGAGPNALVIEPAPDFHCIREVQDGHKGCQCQTHGLAGMVPTANYARGLARQLRSNRGSGNDGGSAQSSNNCNDPVTRVHVLALYDNVARRQAGNDAAIQANVANALSQATTVMRNSQMFLEFRATSIRNVDHNADVDMSSELDRFTGTTDGFMDEIHAWRRQENADLVTLAVGDITAHDTVLGIAWVPLSEQAFRPDSGFSIFEWNSNGSYTPVHEFGHNFGCFHDRANSSGTPWRPYAYGYRYNYSSQWPNKYYFRTVMAYRFQNTLDCPFGWSCQLSVAPTLSSPDVFVDTGRGTYATGNADNNTRQAILDSRQMVVDYSIHLNGGPPRVQITRQPSSRQMCAGTPRDPVIMTVEDNGNGRSYRWEKHNGADWFAMSNQTQPELTLQRITFSDFGQYRCVVTGVCGDETTSRIATLSNGSCGRGLQFSTNGSEYGTVLHPIGDWNGDGYDDLAIGQPDAMPGTRATGSVWIVSGETLQPLDRLNGDRSGQRFGEAIASTDVDGDGYPELIIADPTNGQILSASPGLQDTHTPSLGGLTSIGRRVVGAQFLDSDGHGDIVLGTDTVLVGYSLSSRRERWRATPSTRVDALACLGDVNGDGYDDIAAGMPTHDNDRGRVEVFSGIDGALLHALDGIARARFGYSLAALGDVNDDGIPDLAIGQPDFYSRRGAVSFASGDLTELAQVRGTNLNNRLGWAMSCTGDYNGDGRNDLLVSSYPTGGAAGAILVLDGRTREVLNLRRGLDSTYGQAVASLDSNGDKIVDEFVGNRGNNAVWTYDSPIVSGPPKAISWGSICPDDNYAKLMRASVNEACLGDTARFKVATAPANALVLARVGLLSANFYFRASPRRSCQVLVDPFAFEVAQTNASGTGVWSAPIPQRSDLIGIPLKVQWVTTDPAMPEAVMLSNAVELTIGR